MISIQFILSALGPQNSSHPVGALIHSYISSEHFFSYVAMSDFPPTILVIQFYDSVCSNISV